MVTAPRKFANAVSATHVVRWVTEVSAVRRLQIATLGSGIIYLAYFIFVAFLPEHVTKQRFNLFMALGRGYSSLLIFLIAVGTLFALAIIAWRAAQSAACRQLYGWALIPPVLFGLVLSLTMPATSRDLFYYISSGRTLAIYGANPYLVPPSAFRDDPLFQFTNWPDYTSPYGPIWLLLSGGLAWLGGTNLLWSVYLFKLLAFISYLLCAVFIWQILRKQGYAPLVGTVLWLWCPLILLEFAGSGHNDVVMLCGLLLALWCYLRGQVRLSLVILTVAILVKSVALIALPFILWHYLMTIKGWPARIRAAARVLWLPAVVLVAIVAPFWAGEATFGPAHEANHYYASIAHLVRTISEWWISPYYSGMLARGLILLSLGVGYLLILWKIPGDGHRLLTGLVQAYFLLLIVWPFFVPWYCAWTVALVAALGSTRYGWRALLFCLGAILSYALQFYLPLRMAVSIEFRSALSAAIIFLPLLCTYIPWHRLRRSGPSAPTALPPLAR